MFKYIEYLTADFGRINVTYLRSEYKSPVYIYKLIDTDFECKVLSPARPTLIPAADIAITVLAEYQKRNYSYQEIIKNLFKCNFYLCNKYESSFDDMLNLQYTYLNESCKDINFSKLYYKELNCMWNKHKVFL